MLIINCTLAPGRDWDNFSLCLSPGLGPSPSSMVSQYRSPARICKLGWLPALDTSLLFGLDVSLGELMILLCWTSWIYFNQEKTKIFVRFRCWYWNVIPRMKYFQIHDLKCANVSGQMLHPLKPHSGLNDTPHTPPREWTRLKWCAALHLLQPMLHHVTMLHVTMECWL